MSTDPRVGVEDVAFCDSCGHPWYEHTDFCHFLIARYERCHCMAEATS